MITAQIVIFSFTAICILLGVANHDAKSKWYPITFGLLVVSALMLWAGLFVATLVLNQMENPCPEYEPIENVYKLKQ
jgi:hypothetical protein